MSPWHFQGTKWKLRKNDQIKRIFQINSKLENNQKGQKQPAIVGTVGLVDIVVLECWKNEKQKNNVKNGRETVTLQ